MSDYGELRRIKADLEAPSWSIGGKDAKMVRDMRWLIARVEIQAKEIEQLKSSFLLHDIDLLRRDRLQARTNFIN